MLWPLFGLIRANSSPHTLYHLTIYVGCFFSFLTAMCWPDAHWVFIIFCKGYCHYIGFGGLEVACWPLVPKFAGSNPAEAVGFLRAKKILSTPSFGGEVKPSVPCRRFAACKRSLELPGSRILGQNLSEHFSPTKSPTFRY